MKSLRPPERGYPHRIHRSKKGRKSKYPGHAKNRRYREIRMRLDEDVISGKFD